MVGLAKASPINIRNSQFTRGINKQLHYNELHESVCAMRMIMKNNANMFYMVKHHSHSSVLTAMQFSLALLTMEILWLSMDALISFITTLLILVVSLPTNVCFPNMQSTLTLLVNLHPSCMVQPKTLSND